MATLKKNKKNTEVEEVAETTAPESEGTEYLNEAEQAALAEQHEQEIEDSKKVSIEKMEKAVEVVQNHFNLGDKSFAVNGFADKGNKCQLSMSNEDFDLVVTIKDAEKFMIN